MTGQQAAGKLRQDLHFLMNILKDFKPEHQNFSPAGGMMTVAQQIRHIATELAWLREGAFGAGFDMEFEKVERMNREPCTLPDALMKLKSEYESFTSFLETQTTDQLAAPMAPNPILGEQPHYHVLSMCTDHTAHHRGVLSVYLRLLGITPTMPYT